MTKYDWSNVPKNVNWIATNGRGECVWGYEKKPSMGCGMFLVGRNTGIITVSDQVTPYKGDWRKSLEERPND